MTQTTDSRVSPIDETVLNSSRFRRALLQSMLTTISHDLPAIASVKEPEPSDWSFALLYCSAATGSSSTAVQDAVLRVLQGCLQSDDATAEQKVSATLLLERSGNRQAIDLATKKSYVEPDVWTTAPPTMQLDVIRRRLDLRVDLATGTQIATNAFQRDFWSAAATNRWVSVTAPTSAGKSFIVKQWFLDAATRRREFIGVYLVPTRALIEEVSGDLTEDFPKSVSVLTMPWDTSAGQADKEIYVLTQERLHLLQQQRPMFAPDVLFIDEAHKIGDGTRGILLQQVLDETTRRDAGTQVLFASPLASNPGVLLESAPRATTKQALSSSMVTVNQNLIWADRVPRDRGRMSADLVVDGELLRLGTFELPDRTGRDIERLAFVAVALGAHTTGNVVYCNGAAEAEKIADYLAATLGDAADVSHDPDIAALQQLASTTVHNKFDLIRALDRGIAFHYGNMPLLLKSEIERLFRAKKIQYLVCTSTLLEGVNLPCRNLFVRGPRKGNNNPMSPADFWNLAGRAGRWGIEFQGNIICVDAGRDGVWAHPPRTRTPQPIERAIDAPVRAPESLVELILAGADYDAGEQTALNEAVFNFLGGRIARGISLAQIYGLPADASDQMAELEAVIEQALAQLSLPLEVLTRHTGINPLKMNALHLYFESLDDQSLRQLRLPGPAHRQAVDYYMEALALVAEHLGVSDFGRERRQFQLALLLVHWMRGDSLARIIQDRQTDNLRKGRAVPLPTLIRDVMGDVEKYARFEVPRHLSCYLDILDREIAVRGLSTPHDAVDVEMMLELGVSRTTEVSMMALGLSRASVLALSPTITDDTMTPGDARIWLTETDLEPLNLPVLIEREINRVRDRLQTDG